MIFNKLLTDPTDVIKIVGESIEKQHPLLLTYLNQHSYNIYYSNREYKKLLDSVFTSYQADQGIYLTLKYLFGKKINKIDATAMSQRLLDELILKKIPIAIVGGNFDEKFVREKCDENKINLAGYQNGYFNEVQSKSIIMKMKELNTKIFIVGMGVPQQELFAEKLFQNSTNKVIICVGNFLEFYFGTKKRAPVIIQKIGFEWLFRLFAEPLRLWKRYLVGIPVFCYRIIKMKFNEKSE